MKLSGSKGMHVLISRQNDPLSYYLHTQYQQRGSEEGDSNSLSFNSQSWVLSSVTRLSNI